MKKLFLLGFVFTQSVLADDLFDAIYASNLEKTQNILDQSHLDKAEFIRYLEVADQKIIILRQTISLRGKRGDVKKNGAFYAMKYGQISSLLFSIYAMTLMFLDDSSLSDSESKLLKARFSSLISCSLGSMTCAFLGLFNLEFEDMEGRYCNALTIKDLLYKKYPEFIQ